MELERLLEPEVNEEPIQLVWKHAQTCERLGVLYVNGIPAVSRVEQCLQQNLVRATGIQVGERVLEIGYGLGMASKSIQGYQPTYHCVVELNQELADYARIQGRNVWCMDWKNYRKSFGYDRIIFDPCPIGNEFCASEEQVRSHLNAFDVMTERCLEKNGVATALIFADHRSRALGSFLSKKSNVRSFRFENPYEVGSLVGKQTHVVVLRK